MEQYLSAAEVAKWVGVHYRTIENWAAQGYLERLDGKYGVFSAFKYKLSTLEKELQEIKHDPDSALRRQKLAAEVEKERAIARIKNLEADRMAGLLVDADSVLNSWQNLIASCKAKLLALPVKLALELSSTNDPEQIKERLMVVIDEALKELIN